MVNLGAAKEIYECLQWHALFVVRLQWRLVSEGGSGPCIGRSSSLGVTAGQQNAGPMRSFACQCYVKSQGIMQKINRWFCSGWPKHLLVPISLDF